MLEILVTAEFEKKYSVLPVKIKRKAEKQQKLFSQNPFCPSLKTEKLQPKGRELWSFRVDKQYRIIFRFLDFKKVLFLTVGPHHWIYSV